MADNRYEDYLRERRREQERQEGVNKGTVAAGITGAAALGAYAIINPSGVRSAANKVTGMAGAAGRKATHLLRNRKMHDGAREFGASVKAFDYALQRQSPLKFLLDQSGTFEERFKKSYTDSMEQIIRGGQSKLGGKATQVEKGVFDLLNNYRAAQVNSFKAIQYHTIAQELKQKFPQQMAQGFETILAQRKDEFFKDPSKGKIEGLLDRYSPDNAEKNGFAFSLDMQGKERENFVSEVFRTLDNYKDKHQFDRKVLREGGTINGQQIAGWKKLQEQYLQGFKDSHKEVDGFWQGIMSRTMEKAGYRNLKVGEAVDLGLFDPDSIKRPMKDGRIIDANMDKVMSRLSKHDEEFRDLVVDNALFINDKGDLMDMRSAYSGTYKTLSTIKNEFEIPYLKLNPLDLFHFSTYQSMKEAPMTYLLRRGTIHGYMGDNLQTTSHPFAHNQDAAATPLARDYIQIGDKIVDMISGETAKEGTYLASARFGMVPRMGASMMNLHRADYRNRSLLGSVFDVGRQENEHIWSRLWSVVGKHGDPDWEPNTLSLLRSPNALRQDLEASEFREGGYKNIYGLLDQRVESMSYDTVKYLQQKTGVYDDLGIDLAKLDTEEEIMGALGKIANSMGRPDGSAVRDTPLMSEIYQNWSQYQLNPSEFVKGKRTLSNGLPSMPFPFQSYDVSYTKLEGRTEDMKRLIHQHALEQMKGHEETVGTLVKQGVTSGELRYDAINEVRGLSTLTEMHKYWDDIYKGAEPDKQSALNKFALDLHFNDDFADNLADTVAHHSPSFGLGPGEPPPQYFGLVNYTPMNKARGHRWMLEDYNRRVTEGQDGLSAAMGSMWGVVGQPFAGRRNLQDVTTATMPFYYMAERLDNALSDMGLGLSQKNRGSMQSILLNQFGRRMALPYLALTQLNFFDDMTGDFMSDHVADTYATMHTDVAKFKDAFGLNQLGRDIAGMLPGIDRLGHIPVFAAMKHASFGLLFDNRSAEDLEYYYQHGNDPVRKGRWWAFGSSTPWEGGKIDRFEPNWYRKAKSDYKYSENMYGSPVEYYLNSAIPTPINPLAPITKLFNSRHYERKLQDERPYPFSGGIEELEMIPVVGPFLNDTVGRVVKPRIQYHNLEKAHREYLQELNEYYESQYIGGSGDGYAVFSGSGRHELMKDAPGIIVPGEDVTDKGVITGIGGVGGGPGTGNGVNYTIKNVARGDLENINAGYASIGGGSSPYTPITSLDSLRDPNVVADLADVSDPGRVMSVLGDQWYNVTELAGIYGFGINSFLGFDKKKMPVQWETADEMMGYSRKWWDLEMGGLGGDMSEIGRRYLPNRKKANTYNPIRNTMPDWLPGVNYMTDFKHGDPYTKIAKGEMRLPGDAYEKLNQLHPDAFGEYGAFDRYKILADVAPYSDEYKFYRRIVSQMNQAGLLDESMKEQYAHIRDEVTQRKQKNKFYPYRFSGKDIQTEQVTVTQVLDNNTFLTKEHPNNPIKLAGVKVGANDEQVAEFLSQYIYEGAQLKIGVDSDAMFRVRDNVLETINAVVYSNGKDGMPFYMSTKGQSVNSILSRRRFGGFMGIGGVQLAEQKNDGSAVDTHAIYDQDQVTVGKLWETVVHKMLPEIPIAGPIFDKFIQVRSPLEQYKKQEVYGKAWRPWQEPIDSWIKPMLETAASKNPLLSAAQGFGIGWLAGRGPGLGRYLGSWLGGTIFGGLASARAIDEWVGRKMPGDGEYKWIPERRRKEREINEYFDILNYMKYRGLYEKAADEAKKVEGVDIDAILTENQEKSRKNKGKRKYLESQKKQLSLAKERGYVDKEAVDEQLVDIRDQLSELDIKTVRQLGPRSLQAIQYKSLYESTLYGADPNGDVTQIFKALPGKDRDYYQHFINASPEEREEILQLIPKNQRRFYQARWGMKQDDKQNLQAYFSNHYLPGADWEGWRPDVNLESIKVKVVQNEGLELTEFGLWGDDEKAAQGAPKIDPFKPSNLLDPTRIEKILNGAGLKDVSVTMTSTPSDGNNLIGISFDLLKDRSQELINEINNNLGNLV